MAGGEEGQARPLVMRRCAAERSCLATDPGWSILVSALLSVVLLTLYAEGGNLIFVFVFWSKKLRGEGARTKKQHGAHYYFAEKGPLWKSDMAFVSSLVASRFREPSKLKLGMDATELDCR